MAMGDGDTQKKKVYDLQCDAIDVCMHVCMCGKEGRKEGIKERKKEKCDTLYCTCHTALYKRCAMVTIHMGVGR